MNRRRWKGFVFLDVNDDLLQTVHELGYGLTIRKATLEELSDTQIKGSFQSWSERRGTSVFLNQRMPPPDDDNPSRAGRVLPSPEEWRHAVIECSNATTSFGNVNTAFSLSNVDLRMGFIYFDDNSFTTPFIDFPMLNVRSPLGAMFVHHKLPSIDDLPEIKQNISYVLENVTLDFPDEIGRILWMFTTLDHLPDSSTFKTLGYFAVIEGLLSHAPENSDRVDSIQRQLIRNIKLLNNRLKTIDREIKFSEFSGAKVKTILGKLYDYRSSIAHGNDTESALSDIGKLRQNGEKTNHLWVHDWIRALTKKVLMCAVREPNLVSDLK